MRACPSPLHTHTHAVPPSLSPRVCRSGRWQQQLQTEEGRFFAMRARGPPEEDGGITLDGRDADWQVGWGGVGWDGMRLGEVG